jgi:hypothetical protein
VKFRLSFAFRRAGGLPGWKNVDMGIIFSGPESMATLLYPDEFRRAAERPAAGYFVLVATTWSDLVKNAVAKLADLATKGGDAFGVGPLVDHAQVDGTLSVEEFIVDAARREPHQWQVYPYGSILVEQVHDDGSVDVRWEHGRRKQGHAHHLRLRQHRFEGRATMKISGDAAMGLAVKAKLPVASLPAILVISALTDKQKPLSISLDENNLSQVLDACVKSMQKFEERVQNRDGLMALRELENTARRYRRLVNEHERLQSQARPLLSSGRAMYEELGSGATQAGFLRACGLRADQLLTITPSAASVADRMRQPALGRIWLYGRIAHSCRRYAKGMKAEGLAPERVDAVWEGLGRFAENVRKQDPALGATLARIDRANCEMSTALVDGASREADAECERTFRELLGSCWEDFIGELGSRVTCAQEEFAAHRAEAVTTVSDCDNIAELVRRELTRRRLSNVCKNLSVGLRSLIVDIAVKKVPS